jgi:8-oxo-dGTP pyrophosphatase MutT (NUDIX family)
MSWTPPPTVRPIAVCVVRNGDRIFVQEAHDPADGRTFYRPLGGGIDFGELAIAAARREMAEEASVEVDDLRLLGVLENLFEYNGAPGHEIVMVYEGRFVDDALYRAESVSCVEANGEEFRGLWLGLERARRGEALLFPDGLLGLLE